jgi:hypothetical protein
LQGIAAAAIVAPGLAYAGDVAEADTNGRHGLWIRSCVRTVARWSSGDALV